MQLACTYDVVGYKFTGKERDTESGLDFFGARHYASATSRFMTPDWAAKATAVPYASFGNPQSLNLFSYVQNNPTTVGDPDGHEGPMPYDQAMEMANRMGQSMGPAIERVLSHPAVQAFIMVGTFGAGGAEEGAAEGAVEAGAATAGAAKEATEAGITANAAKGAAFEKAVVEATKTTDTKVAEQVTLKTESGVKTRMDVVSEKPSGGTRLQEAKASETAPLTKNQKLAHPEIEKSGATVAGQGKPGYPGGTKIPPTKVDVVRPKKD